MANFVGLIEDRATAGCRTEGLRIILADDVSFRSSSRILFQNSRTLIMTRAQFLAKSWGGGTTGSAPTMMHSSALTRRSRAGSKNGTCCKAALGQGAGCLSSERSATECKSLIGPRSEMSCLRGVWRLAAGSLDSPSKLRDVDGELWYRLAWGQVGHSFGVEGGKEGCTQTWPARANFWR